MTDLQTALQTAEEHVKYHRTLYTGLENLREVHLQLAEEADARADEIRRVLEEEQ